MNKQNKREKKRKKKFLIFTDPRGSPKLKKIVLYLKSQEKREIANKN